MHFFLRNSPHQDHTASFLRWAALIAVLILGVTSPARASSFQPSDMVTVETGPIQGVTSGGLRIFRGIPYAAPPVGARRFLPPAPASSWTSVRSASAFGAACPQGADSFFFAVGSTAEDCLTLNVYASSTQRATDPLRPVMVWLHGGGFQEGAGSAALFEGSRLANQAGVVLVTLNYRLGALGFLAAASVNGVEGSNNGLLDQRAGLQWVARNIQIFGGDPNNVTLFGESAGGQSVCAHLAMSQSRGLFHKAILQSAGLCSNLPEVAPTSSTGAIARGKELVNAVGCAGVVDEATCLRSKSPADLMTAQGNVTRGVFGGPEIGPNIDGIVLTEQPFATLARDRSALKPMLLGSMQNEGTMFLRGGMFLNRGAGWIYTTANYREVALRLAGSPAQAQKLESVYPVGRIPGDTIARMATEYFWTCSALRLAEVVAAAGLPAYLYDFRGSLSGGGGLVGATHGIDLPFTFGNLDAIPLTAWNSADRTLSNGVIARWGNFAKASNPGSTPVWKTSTSGAYVLAESTLGMTSTLVSGRCELLRRHGLLP